MSEVVELGQITSGPVGVTRVWRARVRIPQLIEEGVHHGIDGRQTLGRGVFKQLRDQFDGAGVGLSENLGKGVSEWEGDAEPS